MFFLVGFIVFLSGFFGLFFFYDNPEWKCSGMLPNARKAGKIILQMFM